MLLNHLLPIPAGHPGASLPDGSAELPTPALIDMILRRFHDGHRRDLEALMPLALRLEAAHGSHAACPRGVADLLEKIRAELAPHMEKEEEILFPMMLVGGSPIIVGPITCMMQDHDELTLHLEEIERITAGFQTPDGACGTWRMLYRTLADFAAEAREHIRIENQVLFPRFAAVTAREG